MGEDARNHIMCGYSIRHASFKTLAYLQQKKKQLNTKQKSIELKLQNLTVISRTWRQNKDHKFYSNKKAIRRKNKFEFGAARIVLRAWHLFLKSEGSV